MTKLSDLKPLKSIAVANAGMLDAQGLTVVAGPNSSGKTQLLKDIQARFIGEGRKLVVCESIEIELPETSEELMQVLCDEGHAAFDVDGKGNEVFKTLSTHLGTSTGGWSVAQNQIHNWYRQSQNRQSNSDAPDPFFQHVGQLLITSLFLDRRLTLVNQVGNFDYERKAPATELQCLYMNPEAQKNLTNEIRRTFGKAIWLDATRGGVLCLRISDTSEIPSDHDLRQPAEMVKYRTIESEGDGLKSYVCICMSLLLGRRPVQVID